MRLTVLVAALMVLASTLPGASAVEGLAIPGSVFPQFWRTIPRVENVVVARLDRFEFPLDQSKTAWEYQERVYLWMPGVNSQQQAFTIYKTAVIKRGWPLKPPYNVENVAFFGGGGLQNWSFDVMGVTWPVVGGIYRIYSWRRTQSPDGYTVYLNERAAKARGFGVMIQVAPPIPPGFR